jgi:hypothetical protein
VNEATREERGLPHPMRLFAIAALVALVPLLDRWFLKDFRIPFPILFGGILAGATLSNYVYWRHWRRDKLNRR